MWESPTEYCEGWNFGPEMDSVLNVWDIATAMIESFGYGDLKDVSNPNALHEAAILMLDITKAKNRLGWRPRLDAKQTIALTADWYKRYKNEDVYNLCIEEIECFLRK
jgi:CDP-glucose 4,6-dehydratase